MGAKQTTEASGQTIKINHPKFNNPQFLKDKEEEEYIQITVPVVNEK